MRHIIGLIAAILGLIGLMAILNASNQAPLLQWPIEALHGLAFSFGWMTSAPTWLAYLLAIVMMVGVAMIFYLLGSWLYHKIINQSANH